ncbi:MAG: CDP-alcohol phosphatidyltransferase family protein [Gemmatimonadota bacterium]|nr:CDP-alcohol phosphatidyltransferase family protein [Gemmatimonadota bacterium]
MNLPNWLTAGRIVAAPFIAWLPFSGSSTARFVAWSLFALAAITDYVDGYLARSRAQITDLGRLLDPLADKLLIVATLIPMFVLTGSGTSASLVSPLTTPMVAGTLGPVMKATGLAAFPFVTPFGLIGLPWWIPVVILGREVYMSVFRQIAKSRGVVISAIGPAKWKTAMQLVWVGSAFFWFFAATVAMNRHWSGAGWRWFANFNGIVGVLMMVGATALTFYSLALYMTRYGRLLRTAA